MGSGWDFADGKLKKIPVGGGPVLTLADAENGRGGSWSEAGQILYTPVPQAALFEVPASGGTPRQITKVSQVHTTNRWPFWLPGGKRFLYLATSHGSKDASDTNGIYVSSTDGRENRMLLPASGSAVYASGYLLYSEQGALMARSFDAERGVLTGDPVAVAQGVQMNRGTWRGAFDASQNGILVYHSGGNLRLAQLLWAIPAKEETGPPAVATTPEAFGALRLSPDGRKLLVAIGDPSAVLWMYDLERGRKTRLTFSGGSISADSPMAWSPDGRRVAYTTTDAGYNFYTTDIGGAGQAGQSNLGCRMHVQPMKTLLNDCDRNEVLHRLGRVRSDSQRRWGSMSAHQMICHLSDSFRAALGEKQISSSSTLFKRTIYKWAALWAPRRWPHGIKTRPEMDQQQGGTRPVEFASDVETLRRLFDQFCGWKGEFTPHAMLGQLSRTERMRHAYLHMDHHFRQFGA